MSAPAYEAFRRVKDARKAAVAQAAPAALAPTAAPGGIAGTGISFAQIKMHRAEDDVAPPPPPAASAACPLIYDFTAFSTCLLC